MMPCSGAFSAMMQDEVTAVNGVNMEKVDGFSHRTIYVDVRRRSFDRALLLCITHLSLKLTLLRKVPYLLANENGSISPSSEPYFDRHQRETGV